jgi:hypothetical protein
MSRCDAHLFNSDRKISAVRSEVIEFGGGSEHATSIHGGTAAEEYHGTLYYATVLVTTRDETEQPTFQKKKLQHRVSLK